MDYYVFQRTSALTLKISFWIMCINSIFWIWYMASKFSFLFDDLRWNVFVFSLSFYSLIKILILLDLNLADKTFGLGKLYIGMRQLTKNVLIMKWGVLAREKEINVSLWKKYEKFENKIVFLDNIIKPKCIDQFYVFHNQITLFYTW